MTGFFSPPSTLGHLFAQLDESEVGREMIRMLMMSYLDVCNEWFQSDKVRAALARWVSEVLAAPEEGGTGAFLLVSEGAEGGGAGLRDSAGASCSVTAAARVAGLRQLVQLQVRVQCPQAVGVAGEHGPSSPVRRLDDVGQRHGVGSQSFRIGGGAQDQAKLRSAGCGQRVEHGHRQ